MKCWPNTKDIDGIDNHQRTQLAKATTGRLGILGGSPGTGKTYTVAKLIRHLLDHSLIGLDDICIGAPTGKAAVRLTEMLQANGIDTRARTLHSHLEIGEHSETGQWTFLRNEKNPLPYRLIVIDETSMNDLAIMLSIFRARAPGCFVLLVGDVNQLPPVGNGAPLRDMIAAGLPYGELREIKRNSGGIVEACGLIRDCQPWVELTDAPESNLKITHDTTHLEKQSRILDLLERSRVAGYDPIWDCQVLVAVNESSPLSRQVLNKMLQSELNPNPQIAGTEFRVADKIVCLKNGFYRSEDPDIIDETEVKKNERDEVYVANGELAEVVEITEKAVIAKLASPARVVAIPLRTQKAEPTDSDSDEPEKKSGTGANWDLGYALSVHKSQGSEWPVVIVALDGWAGAKMICDRAWLYTAISRGKQLVYLVGQADLADRFCLTQKIMDRKTFLSDRIRSEILKHEIAYL